MSISKIKSIPAMIGALALFTTPSVFSANYTIRAKIISGEDKTILLVSKLGQVLDQKSVTSSSQSIRFETSENPDGSTLQIVNGDLAEGAGKSNKASDGKYFGTVGLGWQGSRSNKASSIYTTLRNAKNLKSLNLGVISIKETDGTDDSQGYGITSAKSTFADKNNAVTAKDGVPSGTLASGLAKNQSSGQIAKAAAIGFDPSDTVLPGADYDKDGTPNLFDVDDNNNGVIDNFDSKPLSLSLTNPLDARLCKANNLNLFPNLKATDPSFLTTINFYGTGVHQATDSTIANALTNQLTFAIQPISKVCGTNIAKWEIRGVGVPYAPSSFVEMQIGSTNDIQWNVGSGRNDGSTSNPVTPPFTFSGPRQVSGVDQFEQRVTDTSGRQFTYAGTPNFVFVTHPMLVSYAIDSGSNTSVDYSRAEPQGSANNRINLNAGQKLTIRLHRPQRIGLTGEGFNYYDIGKMVYYIDIPNMPYTSSPSGSGPGRCDAQKVTDTFVDTPVNAASPPAPLEMTVDIDQCFLNAGKTWNSGTRLDLDIQVAAPNGGNSAQKIFLYR